MSVRRPHTPSLKWNEIFEFFQVLKDQFICLLLLVLWGDINSVTPEQKLLCCTHMFCSYSKLHLSLMKVYTNCYWIIDLRFPLNIPKMMNILSTSWFIFHLILDACPSPILNFKTYVNALFSLQSYNLYANFINSQLSFKCLCDSEL